jgi:hypothetical protein
MAMYLVMLFSRRAPELSHDCEGCRFDLSVRADLDYAALSFGERPVIAWSV